MPAFTARLLDVLAPPSCLACARPLGGSATSLCGPCRRRLPWLGATCPSCALPAPCPRGCRGADAPWAVAWAPLAHDGPARALVVALKHRRLLPVAGTMAAQIVAGAPLGLLTDPVTLVPVPADPWRGRVRGVDQADRLAREIGVRTGRPVRPCLRRRRSTTRQAGRGRRSRIDAGRSLELVVGRVPERPVLVDDVHTTGATLDACARALRAQGAGWVGAITYTRALP